MTQSTVRFQPLEGSANLSVHLPNSAQCGWDSCDNFFAEQIAIGYKINDMMKSKLSIRSITWLIGLLLALPAVTFAGVTPYLPYPGAVPSIAYKVTVDGQPVFVHN